MIFPMKKALSIRPPQSSISLFGCAMIILLLFFNNNSSFGQLKVDGPLYVKGTKLGLTVRHQDKKNGTPIILHEGLNQWKMLSNGAIVLKDNPRLGLTVLNQNKKNGTEIILHEGYNLWKVLSNGAIVLKDNPKFGITILNQNKSNDAKIILHEGYNVWTNQAVKTMKISNGYYQLKTHHNTYLQTTPGGAVACSPNSSTWETFEVKVVGTNKIQLRGYHGAFLQAKSDGKVATTSNSSTWETFTLISKGGDKFLLKTHHNTFLQARPEKTVATTSNSSTWETFSFKKVAKPAPPAPPASANNWINGPVYVKGTNLGLTVRHQDKRNNTKIILHEGLNHFHMLANGAIVLKDNPRLGLTVLNQNKKNGTEIILHEGYNLWKVLSNGAIVLKDNPKLGITILNQNRANDAQIILHEGYNVWTNQAVKPLPFANKYVKIINVHSGKNLCTMHWSKDPKSNNNQERIIQYSYSGDPTHIWLVKPVGNDRYILENAQTGKVMCTMHWSKDPKSKNNQERIIQYSYTGDPTHQWRFVDIGNGQWRIVNAHSGKNLCTMHWSKDPKSNNNQEEIIQYDYTGDPTHKWRMEVVSKPQKYVAPPPKETGFRVVINGLRCLQTADGGNGTDEPYIEVFVDNNPKPIKFGSRPMNEADRSGWEQFTDGVESLFRYAQQEYWLMPGSVYAKEKVVIKLWEEDDGRGDSPFINNDDYVGSFTITKNTPNSNFILKEFRGDEGDWDLVCSKIIRGELDPAVEGNSRLVNVRVPVLDQGNEGACVAFAVVGALTTTYLNKTKPGSSREELFDPFALYNRRNKSSYTTGWNIRPCLNEIVNNGIPFKNSSKKLYLKSYIEYHKDGRVIKVTKSGRTTLQAADNKGYNKMRKVLKSGKPLICRYDVYPDFMAYAKVQGVYGGRIFNGSKRPSGHAVFVVGYTNPKINANDSPTWILQNSWNSTFGHNGLCRFAEGACGFDDVMYEIGEFEVK